MKNAVEEQFEGSISVDSEEGRGTKFHIEIPIAKLEEIEVNRRFILLKMICQ